MLIDQFISQLGKQPTEWTSQDIQKYMNYIKKHVTEAASSQIDDD